MAKTSNLEKKKKLIVFFLIALTFLSRVSLGLRDQASLASVIHYDDSFYVHGVSWNLAQGNGLSVDGIHKTNGIQPLIAFLDAPFYIMGGIDKWLGLKLSFLLAAFIDSLSVLIVYRILSKLQKNPDNHVVNSAVVGCILWTFLYTVIYHSMNGLETGLYSFLLLLSTLVYLSAAGTSASVRQKVLLGIALGFTVLSRVDGVFFVLILLCFDFLYYKERNIVRLFIAPCVAFLISVPWWVYNVVFFGHIIPISGQSESIGLSTIPINLFYLGVNLADIASTFFHLPILQVPAFVAYSWIAAVFLFLYIVTRKFSLIKKIRMAFTTTPLLPLFFFGCVLAIIYTLFFQSPFFISRYIQPLRIFWILLASMALPMLLQSMKAISLSLYKTATAVIFVAFILNILQYVRFHTNSDVSTLYLTGLWAQQHPGVTIGMQQSGIASFMSNNVVNLDGKVNAEVLEYRKRGERGKYIYLHHFDYIIDWGVTADVPAKEANAFGSNYQLTNISGLSETAEWLHIYKDNR